MSQIICHNNGKYNIYGTIADAFYFYGALTQEQLKQWVRDERGNACMAMFDLRLNRAHEKGTSSLLDSSLEETLSANRAGENETNLSYEECLKRFFS